jgi:hypothetical protein
MQRFPLVRIATLVTLICVLPNDADPADIVRHCDGSYFMVATLVDGSPPPADLGWDFGDFSASGHCGSTVPNRCRERARDTLRRCYQAHWQVRWDRVRPNECSEQGGVQRYALTDIKTVMEKEVCCSAASLQHKDIVVNLYGSSRGDRGCGADATARLIPTMAEGQRSVLVQADYKMDCPELRKQLCPQYAPKRTNP